MISIDNIFIYHEILSEIHVPEVPKKPIKNSNMKHNYHKKKMENCKAKLPTNINNNCSKI